MSKKQYSIVSELIGKCLCEPFTGLDSRSGPGSGALVDELTPRERVYDTLEQLTTRTQRLISVGYIVDETIVNEKLGSNEPPVITRKGTQSIPLDIWNEHYPNDNTMSRDVKEVISLISSKDYKKLIETLNNSLEHVKKQPNAGLNKYAAGIIAHNLAVAKLLSGNDEDAISTFKEAITLKEEAFGSGHSEVGLTWDELGIQYFARGMFEDSLATFRKAHACRTKNELKAHQKGLDMVLNNMACCNFQLRNHRTALLQLQEARELQQQAIGSAAQADLDLLHVAIVMCNCGYLHLCLKEYDDARSLLEEALLIQQSVFDDNHRAVRDTLSNIEFTNAFHS